MEGIQFDLQLAMDVMPLVHKIRPLNMQNFFLLPPLE